jgi:lipid A 3-O-deacylase PagL
VACAARGRAEAQEPGDQTRVFGLLGRSFDQRTRQRADLVTVAWARDFPFEAGSRFAVTTELYPLMIVNEEDGKSGARVTVPVTAATGLFTYRDNVRGLPWSYRVSAGTGVSMAFGRAVPAGGTHFNFLSQFIFEIVRSLPEGRSISVGYRFFHMSNLDLVPDNDNPGVTLNVLAVAYSWKR